jgi:uncharacterized protein YejL (UPF0352 family)
MAKIHQRGKDKLAELREKHRATTELLLGVLGEILSVLVILDFGFWILDFGFWIV